MGSHPWGRMAAHGGKCLKMSFLQVLTGYAMLGLPHRCRPRDAPAARAGGGFERPWRQSWRGRPRGGDRYQAQSERPKRVPRHQTRCRKLRPTSRRGSQRPRGPEATGRLRPTRTAEGRGDRPGRTPGLVVLCLRSETHQPTRRGSSLRRRFDNCVWSDMAPQCQRPISRATGSYQGRVTSAQAMRRRRLSQVGAMCQLMSFCQ